MISCDSRESSGYDFISHFNQADKQGFSVTPEFELVTEQTKPFDVKFLIDRFTRISSANVTRIYKDGFHLKNAGGKRNDGLFWLNFKFRAEPMPEFHIKIRETSPSSYTNIVFNPNKYDDAIILTRFSDNKPVSTDKIKYSVNQNSSNLLLIGFFDNFLVITDSNKLLFQQWTEIPSPGGSVTVSEITENADNLKYSLKYSAIDVNERNKLTEWFNWKYKKATEHKYNFTKRAEKWNTLAPRNRIVLNDAESPFLLRFESGDFVRRSILFPAESALEYLVDIPMKASLRFSILGGDSLPEAGVFQVNIDNGEIDKKYEIQLDDLHEGKTEFRDFRFDLEDVYGRNCKVRFKYLPAYYSDEYPGPLVLGAPSISTERKNNDINVVLISIDTLRADHLGCYGYKRDTSPNIDRFAADNTVFEMVTACSDWTVPSHMSIFSSMYPFEAGFVKSTRVFEKSYLSDSIPTITEYLRNANYMTFGIHGGGYVSPIYGFDKGFDLYRKSKGDVSLAVDRAIELLEKNRDRKLFLFFHTFEIHAPYIHKDYLMQPGADKMDHKEKVIAAYDSGIKYTDIHIGRLIEWFDKNGLMDNTLFIITSDHGETFRGVNEKSKSGFHGNTLFDSETHVPLIIGGVSEFKKSERIKGQVSSVDILPTLTSLLGIQLKTKVRGKDLRETKGTRTEQRVAYSEATHTKLERKSVRTLDYKLIQNFLLDSPKKRKAQNPFVFFNLREDKEEINNIWGEGKGPDNIYKNYLIKIIRSIEENRRKLKSPGGGDITPSDELADELKNLGYLGN
ncbi:MAG: sulfatase [Acidobacteria bacterium]|nr:sulfatase [Acidobacteriota bacterium]